MSFSSIFLSGAIAFISFIQCIHAEGSRTPKVFWSKPATVPHSLGGHLGFSSFGIDFIERSNETVSDRYFLVTALWVVDDIYRNHNNHSEIVRNYKFGDVVPGYPPLLNISAVGRGLDPGSPFAFNNAAMVLFLRWLGQFSRAHRWETFGCYFGVFEHGGVREELVAIGNFTSTNYTGTTPEFSRHAVV